MCGLNLQLLRNLDNETILKYLSYGINISHRGPDNSSIVILNNVKVILDFKRLAINDLSLNGNQPFKFSDEKREIYLMCNGEIYNNLSFHDNFDIPAPLTNSDCECLLLMYVKYGIEGLSELLNSEHAFVILDINKEDNTYIVYLSTDRFGIKPLFINCSDLGISISSELIGVPRFDNSEVFRVKPREIYTIKDFSISSKEYYNLKDIEQVDKSFYEFCKDFKERLTNSVQLRCRSDREIGAPLSGGMDSSVVCLIASNYLKSKGKKLRTFCCGLEGSDDAIYAKITADFLGTDHTFIEIPEEDYIKIIPEIIKAIGSFDTTSVRASIGQFYTSKFISENTDIKVLLSGDGADELLCGYDENKYAPSALACKERSIYLLENIHNYDGLRMDRCSSFFGEEMRPPFLDVNVVECVISMPAEYLVPRGNLSKIILREGFKNDLPEEIVNRPKVTFSDGVGNKEKRSQSRLKNFFDSYYTKEQLKEIQDKYAYHCKPETNEEAYYREIFTQIYGDNQTVAKTIPAFWKPAFRKDNSEGYIDPSAMVNA